jgi:invasion protein IalB
MHSEARVEDEEASRLKAKLGGSTCLPVKCLIKVIGDAELLNGNFKHNGFLEVVFPLTRIQGSKKFHISERPYQTRQ